MAGQGDKSSQRVPSAVDPSQSSPTTRYKSVLRVRIMVSGSSLHIKVGAGRRERTGNVEAARCNRDPTSGPTVAPGTRALAVVSTSWFAAALRFALARAKSWGFDCYREGSALRERGTELGSRGSSSEDAQPWPGQERTALHPNAGVLCSPRALRAAPSHCARPHGRDPRCGLRLGSDSTHRTPGPAQSPPGFRPTPPSPFPGMFSQGLPFCGGGKRLKVANYWPLG